MADLSIAGAKAAVPHVPVTHAAYPPGKRGLEVSLDTVGERIRQGRLDPRVRSWAIRTLKDAGNPQGFIQKAQALLDGQRKAAIYVSDPVNAEYIQAAHETLCLDDKGYCFKGGDCFPQGTLILRDDYELVPIEDIKVGDKIWGLDKWTTVEAKAFKGRLLVDGIVCNNGSVVQLTQDHKVFVARCPVHESNVTPCSCPVSERRIDRVTVKDLAEKDVLLQPERIAFGSSDLDPDRALVEGLYVSDGWCEDYRFAISGQDGCPKEAQKLEVKAICERLGVDTRWHRKYIAINDSEWTLRMQQMGTHAPEKHLLSINLGEAAAANTLRGVMADSGANTNGPGRTFTSTSKQLTTQTRVLHRMFGLSCSIRYIEDHGGLGKNPIWRLGVRVKDRADEKAEKLLRVKAVERRLSVAPCYDIQTSDHYVYLPEHDVTVSNCDDLSVALGSALMSVGIPVIVIGQAFQNSSVPQHVLVGIVDTKNDITYRIDPSSDTFDVGQSYPGVTHEWHIDPMKTVNTKLDGVGLDNGEIVGVGRAPTHHGLGADSSTVIPENDAIYQAATSQLKIATFALQKSVASLTAALNEVENTRSILRPNMPYDPEPANPITSLASFPTGGIWTKSMSNLAHDMLHTGEQVANALQEALNGTRKTYIDLATKEAYIESLPHDSVRYQIIKQGVTDSIVGVFSGSSGLLLAGFTALLGAILTPNDIEQQQTGVQGSPARQGHTGVGVGPVVVISAIVGGVVAGLTVAYIIKRLCETADVKAREAAKATILNMVASGRLTKEQGQDLLDADSKNRVAEQDAQAKANASDPFASTFKSVGTVIMWAAIGGATIAGIYAVAPLLKEGAEGLKQHRLSKAPSPA